MGWPPKRDTAAERAGHLEPRERPRDDGSHEKQRHRDHGDAPSHGGKQQPDRNQNSTRTTSCSMKISQTVVALIACDTTMASGRAVEQIVASAISPTDAPGLPVTFAPHDLELVP